MPTTIKSKRGLVNMHKEASEEVREFFEHVEELVENYTLDVCLAYVFMRLERGQNAALYGGLVKVHNVKSDFAKKIVHNQHMTRSKFVDLYKTVYGKKLPQNAHQDLKTAEKIRDKVMHGKKSTDDEIRNAIASVIEFAEEVNTQLTQVCSLRPFGKMQGFSGKTKKLEDRVSQFMVKGMGFGKA